MANPILSFLSPIFSWWNGPTVGTMLTVGSRGRLVGSDDYGNRYYEDRTNKDSYDGRKRRWVLYKGYAEASKIRPEWHGWMHYIYDDAPSDNPPVLKAWEKPHRPNLTGTPYAWVPPGSLRADAERSPSTGDYEAWEP